MSNAVILFQKEICLGSDNGEQQSQLRIMRGNFALSPDGGRVYVERRMTATERLVGEMQCLRNNKVNSWCKIMRQPICSFDRRQGVEDRYLDLATSESYRHPQLVSHSLQLQIAPRPF